MGHHCLGQTVTNNYSRQRLLFVNGMIAHRFLSRLDRRPSHYKIAAPIESLVVSLSLGFQRLLTNKMRERGREMVKRERGMGEGERGK